jgi:NAD(P)-dependent dehydrogenase (short-subunit alcohol dehydrogenase family)
VLLAVTNTPSPLNLRGHEDTKPARNVDIRFALRPPPFVQVNALCPNCVETDILAAMTDHERKPTGEQREIATPNRFLACAEAACITGSILKADGGTL